MGVAAQVAARGLRRYGQALLPAMPASPGAHGSGEQPSGLPQVELYLGGWVDMTALGLVRHQQGVHITRGQPDENQKTNPSTATFRLQNTDGRFNPRNPLGPYYGLIDKNTPCRISVQSGNSKSYRFYGEVSSWPQDWDKTGNDAWVDVQAAGILRRLSAGNPPIRSAAYFYWVYAATQNANNTPPVPVVAYWPCEDAAGATQLASGISGTPLQIAGTPTLASNSSFVISQSLPVLNGASFHGTIPAYTPSAPAFQAAVLGDTNQVMLSFLLDVPASGDTSGTLLTLSTNGAIPTWEIFYTNSGGGTVAARCKDVNGAVLSTTPASNPLNGVPSVVALVIDHYAQAPVGSVGTCRVSTAANPTSVQTLSTSTVTGDFGLAKSVIFNPGGALMQSAIGHIGFMPFDDGGASAAAGNAGERAAARIQRLCGYANIPFELTGNASDTVVMGQEDPGTLLNLIQECVDADGGILYELLDQIGLGYRTRTSLENQSPVLALDYAQAQLVDVPKPVDDDTFTRNDITVTRLNGSSARAFQATGPLNFQTPPAGVGRVETSVTLNVQTDSQAADEAGWRLHLGTVNEARYPGIGVELFRRVVTSSTTLRPQILGVNPGDRITVANPPSFALAVDTISALAIGWSETFNQFTHHVAWNTRPESPFRVATADDAVFGRADTDGSTLAQPLGPADTTALFATTSPASPLWTTQAGDFPFDVNISGERVTVTNITGSSSPQTATLTRSVNGVVKPQAQNTAVQLWQPAIVSM